MIAGGLLATALVAVAVRGGYTETGRGLTLVAAALALGFAVVREPVAVGRAARTAPPVLLGCLAVLGALSAAWTVGPVDDALRWALVLAALAAVMVSAAALPRPEAAAGILLVVGTGAAAVGLVGAVGHVDRIGLDICGSWRPAGPFEYPPALALACVGALPCAVWGMSWARGAAGFAAVGWLLVVTVLVSGSRVEVALAVGALVAAGVLLEGGAAAAGVLIVAGGFTALVVGGDLGDDGAGTVAVAGVLGVVAAVAWPWLAVRGGGRATWLVVLCVVGIACVAGANVAERVGGCAYAGLTHGRTGIWKAAWRTAQDRPVFGHGLESFAVASRRQQLRERDVPVQYAHNLPLEAWVELGLVGAALVLALYAAVALEVLRASRTAAALLGPAALGFLVANLFDWPWHLAGSAVLWAIAVGALLPPAVERFTGRARMTPSSRGGAVR